MASAVCVGDQCQSNGDSGHENQETNDQRRHATTHEVTVNAQTRPRTPTRKNPSEAKLIKYHEGTSISAITCCPVELSARRASASVTWFFMSEHLTFLDGKSLSFPLGNSRIRVPGSLTSVEPSGRLGCCRLRRRVFMKISGISAALPAQDPGRAKAFYIEKVGLQAVESTFLEATDGRVGLTIGDGVNQLFVYPAEVSSSGNFTQVVIQVADVRVCRRNDEGPRREVRGVRHRRDVDRQRHCADAGWRRGGVVQRLGRQFGRRRSDPRWLETGTRSLSYAVCTCRGAARSCWSSIVFPAGSVIQI